MRVLDRIVLVLGDEEKGTGLVGEVGRIRVTVQGHDRLAATIRGGFVATGALIIVIWWLIKDKLSKAFGMSA